MIARHADDQDAVRERDEPFGDVGLGAALRSSWYARCVVRWLLGLWLCLCGCGHEGRDQSELRCVEPPHPVASAVEAPTCVAGCGAGDPAPACPESCGRQLAFEWTVPLADASCQREPVVAADVPDYVIVAGGKDHRSGSSQLWIAGMDLRGCALWIDTEGDPVADSLVLGVAGAPDVGYYAVGQVREPAQGDDFLLSAWIRRYDADGDVLWTRRERSSGRMIASSVAVDVDGGAIVVGGFYSPTHSARGWLRRFSADGEPRGEDLWLGAGPDTHVLDVATSREGRTWISLWATEGSSTRGWIAEVDERSEILWLQPSTDPHTRYARLALAFDASPLLVEHGAWASPRVSRWTADGELLWATAPADIYGLDVERATTTPDGTIIVVGATDRPVVLLFDPDGELMGLQQVPGIDHGTASDVSIAPDGSIYVTGLVYRDEGDEREHCDTWLARARLD